MNHHSYIFLREIVNNGHPTVLGNLDALNKATKSILLNFCACKDVLNLLWISMCLSISSVFFGQVASFSCCNPIRDEIAVISLKLNLPSHNKPHLLFSENVMGRKLAQLY